MQASAAGTSGAEPPALVVHPTRLCGHDAWPCMQGNGILLYRNEMDISVTAFRRRCLDIIRRVEQRGKQVTITRRGKVVARLGPAPGGPKGAGKPWERLRAMGGRCDFAAEESMLRERDPTALR